MGTAEPVSTYLQNLSAKKNAPTTETARICALPRVDYTGRDVSHLIDPNGSLSLRPVQHQCLWAAAENGGGFFPVGVGEGKTWIALLSGTVLDADLTIIITKARLVFAMERERLRLKDAFRLTPTRIISYEYLSRPESAELLDQLVAPFQRVVIVADEAHCLSSRDSARTRRVIRLFQDHPYLCFIAMSGTLLRRGVDDCAHLAELALRHRSPLPRSKAHLNAWAEVLDVGGMPSESDFERIKPLADFCAVSLDGLRSTAKIIGYRHAFQERLKSCPGVVTTDQNSLGASLELVPVKIKTPQNIANHLKKLKSQGVTPGGEFVESDVEEWRKQRELSCGFYYRWDWPQGPDFEWLDARREWNRQVRNELKHAARSGYDSPALVRDEIQRQINQGDPARDIHTALVIWRGVEHRPEPPTVPIWVDSFLIEDVVELAKSCPEPVIVWFSSDAVGNALSERGLDLFGKNTELETIEPRTVAASINVHGTGANLQGWSTAIVVEPPSSGDQWEQLLGRLHRPGQQADTVTFYVYQHATPFTNALRSARSKAQFVEETTGNRQKLVYASRAGVLER